MQPLILRQRASFTTFASLPVHQREAALKGHRYMIAPLRAID